MKPISEDIRKNLSGRFSGKGNPTYGVKKFGNKNPFYGKKHTAETKRKMILLDLKVEVSYED